MTGSRARRGKWGRACVPMEPGTALDVVVVSGRGHGIVEAHRQAKEHARGAIRASLAGRHSLGHGAHMPDVVRLSEGEALMPRKLRELRAELVKAGFKKVHQKGNHERWRHSLVPTYPVTLAGKDGDDARDYQEKQVRGAIHAAQEAERKRKP